jgi:hypothetical protein
MLSIPNLHALQFSVSVVRKAKTTDPLLREIIRKEIIRTGGSNHH